MKRKKIEPGEEFIMGTEVFCYNLVDGKLILKKIGSAGVKQSKQFTPPTLDEVKAFFKEKGYNDIGAKKAWDYYEAGNWHDGKGNPVKNWKQKLTGIWLKDEYKIQQPQQQQNKVVSNFFQND